MLPAQKPRSVTASTTIATVKSTTERCVLVVGVYPKPEAKLSVRSPAKMVSAPQGTDATPERSYVWLDLVHKPSASPVKFVPKKQAKLFAKTYVLLCSAPQVKRVV